jgi:hypothetical protein
MVATETFGQCQRFVGSRLNGMGCGQQRRRPDLLEPAICRNLCESEAEWLLNSGDAVGLHCRQNASFHAEGDQLNNGDKVRSKRAAPQGRFELFPII